MTRITVDVDDALLEDARSVLGTTTKVGTINAALQAFAVRRQAADILAALDAVPVEVATAPWHHGGERDLSALVERAKQG